MSMLGGRCRAQEGGTCRPLFRQKPDDPSWLVTSRSLASSLVSWPPSSSRSGGSVHPAGKSLVSTAAKGHVQLPSTSATMAPPRPERFRGITIGQKSPQEEAGLETNTVGLLCVFGLPQPASFC